MTEMKLKGILSRTTTMLIVLSYMIGINGYGNDGIQRIHVNINHHSNSAQIGVVTSSSTYTRKTFLGFIISPLMLNTVISTAQAQDVTDDPFAVFGTSLQKDGDSFLQSIPISNTGVTTNKSSRDSMRSSNGNLGQDFNSRDEFEKGKQNSNLFETLDESKSKKRRSDDPRSHG